MILLVRVTGSLVEQAFREGSEIKATRVETGVPAEAELRGASFDGDQVTLEFYVPARGEGRFITPKFKEI